MTAGDLHRFADGYRFYETLPGSPYWWGVCDKCGVKVLEAEKRRRQVPRPETFCDPCTRMKLGMT